MAKIEIPSIRAQSRPVKQPRAISLNDPSKPMDPGWTSAGGDAILLDALQSFLYS
jgi:hypothetical protein